MTVIKTKDLKRSFKDLIAVNEISFEVERGEIFGFLGPNGAGKTTTVRMLTGILKPDGGDAWILGKSIKDHILEIKKDIGVAPETSNAYRELSGMQNMKLTGKIYGLNKTKIKNRSRELLKEFGIYDRRNEKVKNYSKGMKQRLTLSLSLINDPKILFLDEPTSGLDVQSQRVIRNKIKDLNEREDKTVFLTTHNIPEADQLCDRVAIIDNGKIATVEKPEKLKNKIEKTKSILISLKPNISIKDAKKLQKASKIEKEGDKLQIYSENINALIHEISDYSSREDKKIITLKTLGPSLEDVFTELTGN